jgi:hypothetical protein
LRVSNATLPQAVLFALQRGAGNTAVATALPMTTLQRQDAGPRIDERPQALEDLRRERERLIDERDHPPSDPDLDDLPGEIAQAPTGCLRH